MSFYGKGDTGIIDAVCKLSKGVSGAWGNYQHIQKFFRTDWLCVEDGMYDLVIADFLDLDKIVVETVCRLASETAPDYDLEKIYESYWQLTHYDNSIVIKS